METALSTMSALLLVFLLCIFTNEKKEETGNQMNIHCKTQKDSLTKIIVYINAGREPENEGGQFALMRKLARITLDSVPDDFDTKFVVAVIIKKDGQIIGERILKDKTGGTVGRQMIEILKSFKWTPGE